MSDVKTISRDLEANNLVVVGRKNGSGSDLVVAYTSEFRGEVYFHIRTVWQDKRGKWNAGKGMAISPDNAKNVLTALGAAAAQF